MSYSRIATAPQNTSATTSSTRDDDSDAEDLEQESFSGGDGDLPKLHHGSLTGGLTRELDSGVEMADSFSAKHLAALDFADPAGAAKTFSPLLSDDSLGAPAVSSDGVSASSTLNTDAEASTVVPRHKVWLAVLALAIAIVSMSAVGPTFKLLGQLGAAPLRSAAWRTEAALMFMALPTAIELYFTDTAQLKKCLQWRVVVCTVVYSLVWALSLELWVLALRLTTTVRASLLSQLHPIIVAIGMRLFGVKLSAGELVGLAITLGGLGISAVADLSETADNEYSYVGDLLSFSMSFLYVATVVSARGARQVMSVYLFTFVGSVILLVCTTFATVVFDGTTFDDSDAGLFGWIHGDFLPVILVLGFTVGTVGTVGYNFSVLYISPLVFCMVELLDPVLTGVIAYFMGITEASLDLWTCLGGSVIMVGIGVVVFYEQRRTATGTEWTPLAVAVPEDEKDPEKALDQLGKQPTLKEA